MTPTTEWIGQHAVLLWLLLIMLGMLTADRGWQRQLAWQQELDADGGHHPLHAAGLMMLLFALLAFAGLAVAVTASPAGLLPRFDMALAQSLHDDLPQAALQVISILTHLGDAALIAPVALLILVILLRRKQWPLALAWVLAPGGVMPINAVLKRLFQRPRPLHDHGFISEAGWSFPSGHAFGSLVFYGMLAYVLLRLLPARFHRGVILTAAGLIGMIGGSRVLLQVHYLSDVLAGYACGAVWLLLCITMANYGRNARATA